MNSMRRRFAIQLLMLIFVLTAFAVAAAEAPMDWERARGLRQKALRGEKLSPEEQDYYDRALQLRARGARPDAEQPTRERSQVAKEVAHFTPLTELQDQYKGEDGGLYGGGRNEPPAELAEAARRETEKIRPLDRAGQPDESGKIVLLSLGMSNTTQEYAQFKRLADADPQQSPRLLIVDGAQGGQDARRTSDESAPFWSNVDQRLQASGVTSQQVQVIWLKQAMIQPREDFPAEARRLQGLLGQIVHIAQRRYPNLRVVYLSSRTYAGYASTALNPEPHAYESAFAVRWLIQEQLKAGTKTPVLLWGPYLWADGANVRKSDGLTWNREDAAADGTHPSDSGRRKVAGLLLNFFKTDPRTQLWFIRPDGQSRRERP